MHYYSKLLLNISKDIILNKALINTLILNLAKIFTGPILLILVPVYLSEQMQGYWYTFFSISALSLLADLGFSSIVTQFTAHEFYKLSFNKEGEIIGDANGFVKIVSLFNYICIRTICVVTFAFIIIFFIGLKILDTENVSFEWKIPWLIFNMSSGVKFFINVILSFFG